MATYYISEANGFDTRSAAEAQSQSTPWKSYKNVPNVVQAGDSVLFERGGKYYPEIEAYHGLMQVVYPSAKHGTSGARINYGAYGSGPQPELTSLKDLDLGTGVPVSGYAGIFEYNVTVWEQLSIVLINNTLRSVARWPKLGDDSISAGHNGYIKTISEAGAGGRSAPSTFDTTYDPQMNLVGADLVAKNNHYVVSAQPITSQGAGTITRGENVYPTVRFGIIRSNTHWDADYGFFFQNHINVLKRNIDEGNAQIGDWAYVKGGTNGTGKLYIYWGGSGAGANTVKYATTNHIMWHLSTNYINFSDLHFKGSNFACVKIQNSHNCTYNNCTFTAAGMHHIERVNDCDNIEIKNCKFYDAYTGAITSGVRGTSGWLIENNEIHNISMVLGAHRFCNQQEVNPQGVVQQHPDQQGTNGGAALGEDRNNLIIRGNRIYNCGYNAIHIGTGYNTICENNFMTNFCANTMDGSGIYTYNSNTGTTFDQSTKRIVRNNICISGAGDSGGTHDVNYFPTYGIYMDDDVTDVDIYNNLVVGAGDAGYYLHNTQRINMYNNTAFDCQKALMIKYGDNQSTRQPEGNIITQNVFVAKKRGQQIYDFLIDNISGAHANTQISQIGSFSNNKHYSPYTFDRFNIRTYKPISGISEPQRWYNLETFKLKYPAFDAGTITDTPVGYTVVSTTPAFTENFNIPDQNTYPNSFSGTQIHGDRKLRVTGGRLELYVSGPDASNPNARHTVLFVHSTPLVAGKNYRIRFKAQSAGNTFVVSTYLHNNPNSADKWTRFMVTPTETEVSLYFPAVQGDTYTTLMLETENTNGTYFIDDYVIEEVVATYPVSNDLLKAIYNEMNAPASVAYTGGTFHNIATGVTLGASPLSMTANQFVIAKAGAGDSGGGNPPPDPDPTGVVNISKGNGGGNKRKRNVKQA